MKILTSPFLVSARNPRHHDHFPHKSHFPNILTNRTFKPCMISIKPPPPDFDFRSEFLSDSRATIAETHPELLDLADNGGLVLIKKSQFGPVPIWRTEFVEPELIWLIGTNHISQESAADVERVVRAVKPDNVVVELCRSRAGIMYTSNDEELGPQLKSNMFSLTGSGFFGAVGRSINLGGQTALALRLLLAVLSSKVSSEVRRPFGDEFRAARRTSEEVGAQIVLGDRPIEITLERAWSSLKLHEKLSLVFSVVRGITAESDLSRNTLKESNNVNRNFQLYEQLSFSFPSLLQPLIHERDTYLAWSLKRSKAVNRSKRVVGVIGKGHMNGVIYALVSDLGDLRFRDLVGQRSSGTTNSGGWVDELLRNLGEKSRLSDQHSHFQTEKSLENMISILVVDDDTTCLSIVAALLKKWKYQVMTVKHPMDALCTLRIKGVRFDLVVSDVHLPDMDGFELQQQIHQEFKIPVVLMSVDNEEGVIVKGIESGAAFFIVKPISSEDLKDLWQFAASSGKKLGGKATIIKEIANGDSQSKTDYKRKSSSNVYDAKRNYNVTTLKKTKMTWTNALHNLFLEAIRSLGSEKAVPKNILEFMEVPGLTREHVASHLQKYRIFLRQVASCNAQCPDSAGMNFQSSFVSGNPNALMLNSLLQQQLRSSFLHQRLGGLNDIPVFNSSKFSSMSFLNQEAPINRSTPPSSGYQKSCLLCNQGIPSGLMGGTNSKLMYQPQTQAVQNFQTNGLTNYGSPTSGIRGNIPAANEIMGTSNISGPIQNLSNFNGNYICHQTPAEQFCTGNEGQIDHTYDIVNNPSIVDNYFRQQSSGPGDLSSSFFNGINTQYLTNQVQNEQENANLDTSVGSNRVGDTIMMNGQPSDKPFSGEEVLLPNSSFGNDGIQSDDMFSWFDQDQIHSQQYYHEGIMSYSMDNIDDTSKFNDKSYPSIS